MKFCSLTIVIALFAATSVVAGARQVHYAGSTDNSARIYQSAHFMLRAASGPHIDRILDELEHAYDRVREYGLELPSKINVRCHATGADFRRVTGGQSMHIAMSIGQTVHLQPPDVLIKRPELARAFRHELVHVALADAVGDGLPRWFNEGMAMVVAGEMYPETIQFTDLKSLADTLGSSTRHTVLRSAYATAGRLVRGLLSQHGRDKVLAMIAGIGKNSGFAVRFQMLAGRSVEAWTQQQLRK